MNQKPLVIYHANCLDGFGAALAAWLVYKDEFEYLPLQYGDIKQLDDLPNISDRDVYILDFSFSKEITEGIIDICAKFVWLDHHETAFKEYGCDNLEYYVQALEEYDGLILLNNSKSGAVLAWEYFHGTVPNLIQHIDDRDRWQWKLPFTKEICLALSLYPQDFAEWEILIEPDGYFKLQDQGNAIRHYYDEQLTRAIDSTVETCTILGITGLCCNLPPLFASEAGNTLAKRSGTFGATWFKDSAGNIKWSLRSIGDFNVADIAEQFGGGGHKNAAGFTLVPESGMTQPGVTLWHT